ncbi:glycosyl transferase [Dyadobacter luteus]|uniref:Glycosyl transferase n=1 Tax=Dyadobacter luteus TaxID=2259619 RepID=A0A3D8YEY5_9BACT|nr:glycosyl transferase [Dyadobacter luteus]REA63045.1 glycosyl transferase [Dyadobacter luteus]
MQYFCTLFNSFYLSRGLAMYNSLVRQTSDFHLFIFAFDQPSCELLKGMDLPSATIISLQEFETEELLSVKDSRTVGEYCWTCTSFTIWHCIHHYNLDHCTYLDADLLFFSDPKVLTDEMGENDVLITRHNYSKEYDQSELSGIYCVQFLTFKNTVRGLKALDWWCKVCLDWCYSRFEDGKFGDQKYLDDWTERFEGVHVLENYGGGVAPWNSKDYKFQDAGGRVIIQSEREQKTELVFYHFHDFRYCENGNFRLTAEQYLLNGDVVRNVYQPYAKGLKQAEQQVTQFDPKAVYHERLLPMKWIYVSLSRRIRFMVSGAHKNYAKKSYLL